MTVAPATGMVILQNTPISSLLIVGELDRNLARVARAAKAVKAQNRLSDMVNMGQILVH